MAAHRIAVVEDDVDTSRTIGAVLREAGYQTVSYFQPSTDILHHLKAYAPGLIVLDARFDGSVSGWDIIEALKEDESARSIPIVLVSGAADQIAAHRDLLQRHGIPVLPKPFDIDDLETLVNRTLGE